MSLSYKDYYSLLEISRSASGDEVRRSYLKLARKYHPDLNSGDKAYEEKLKEINEAYEVLSDSEKRREYDDLGSQLKHGAPFTPPPQRSHATPHQPRPAQSPKLGFSEFFEALFGSNKGASNKPGRDKSDPRLRAEIVLSLESAHRGGLHKVLLREKRTCPACAGRKRLGPLPCDRCRGMGVASVERAFDVNIPPGARDGAVLKLARRDGRHSRDEMHVRLRVKPHPLYEVSGDDLIAEIKITPWEAVLGTEVSVPTLDGPIPVRIQESSQTGQMVRLKSYGLNKRDGTRGDLYAKLAIVVPDRPSEEERRLWAEMGRLSSFKPRPEKPE
ncbi:MAG TPA: J domain-containing protein [Blastocatellia bacterium]|nr:J domain-containing protein [Blastocatellia bacterium]